MSSDLLPKENEQNTDQQDQVNPLEFHVAYMPGENGKRNYLSDGRGNLRVFKTDEAVRNYLRDFLQPYMAHELFETIVVHPIQGQIVVPDDGNPEYMTIAPYEQSPLVLPLQTLAPDTIPTAMEQLKDLEQRRQHKKG